MPLAGIPVYLVSSVQDALLLFWESPGCGEAQNSVLFFLSTYEHISTCPLLRLGLTSLPSNS